MEIIKIVQGGIELDVIGSVDASSIIQDANNRFVTDAEKTTWNNKQDKLTAGTNVTITGTTINSKDTTYDVATTTTDGLMSSADKVKLNGVETGAQKNSVTSVQGRTGAVTVSKSDVGLGNVDNIKQMPISGGILENYREKLVTVAASGGSINLSLGNVFVHTPSGNITYSITNAVNGQAHSFTLIVNMGSTVRTLTFPASVKWQGGEIPDLTTASKTYVLTFVSVNGGTTWLGMFGGGFDTRTFYNIYFDSETVQVYDEVSNALKELNETYISVPTTFRYKVHAYATAVRVNVNGTLVGMNGHNVFAEGFDGGTEGNFDLSALATFIGMDIEDIVSIKFTGFLD